MAFSFLPREDEYFALFSQMTEKIQQASNAMVEMMQDKNESFEAHVKFIKDIEHECDELTHKVVTKLNKSFITFSFFPPKIRLSLPNHLQFIKFSSAMNFKNQSEYLMNAHKLWFAY